MCRWTSAEATRPKADRQTGGQANPGSPALSVAGRDAGEMGSGKAQRRQRRRIDAYRRAHADGHRRLRVRSHPFGIDPACAPAQAGAHGPAKVPFRPGLLPAQEHGFPFYADRLQRSGQGHGLNPPREESGETRSFPGHRQVGRGARRTIGIIPLHHRLRRRPPSRPGEAPVPSERRRKPAAQIGHGHPIPCSPTPAIPRLYGATGWARSTRAATISRLLRSIDQSRPGSAGSQSIAWPLVAMA